MIWLIGFCEAVLAVLNFDHQSSVVNVSPLGLPPSMHSLTEAGYRPLTHDITNDISWPVCHVGGQV